MLDTDPLTLYGYEDRRGIPERKRKKETCIDKEQDEKRLEDIVLGEKQTRSGYIWVSCWKKKRCIRFILLLIVYQANDSSCESDNEEENDDTHKRGAVLEATPVWHDDDDELIRSVYNNCN